MLFVILAMSVILVVIFVCFHFLLLIRNSNYWTKRGVFSPNSRAVFGNLPGQVNGKKHLMYDLDDLYKKYKNDHGAIGIFSFREPRLLILDPEMIKDVMIRHFKHFQASEFKAKLDTSSDRLFANHPFFLSGEKWKEIRSDIAPFFTNSKIKALFPVFHDFSMKWVNYVRSQCDKVDGIDAKNLGARFSLSMVLNNIFNSEDDCFDGEKKPDILKITETFTAPSKPNFLWNLMLTLYPFLHSFSKMSFAESHVINSYIEMMQCAVESRQRNQVQRGDYLDQLIKLKNKKNLTIHNLSSYAIAFDGFDTTSSVINNALYEIARNRKVQQRLREEIKRYMPNEEDFTYENVVNHEYLDQVWYECLRIRTTVTHLSRMCTEEIELEAGGGKKITLYPGDVVLVPNSMHMDPDYFPHPEIFNPERFSAENGGAKSYIDRGVFLPFGIGPRSCPGNRFGFAQTKMCLVALVSNFDISLNERTPENVEIHPHTFISTVPNCYLNFTPIK